MGFDLFMTVAAIVAAGRGHLGHPQAIPKRKR